MVCGVRLLLREASVILLEDVFGGFASSPMYWSYVKPARLAALRVRRLRYTQERCHAMMPISRTMLMSR